MRSFRQGTRFLTAPGGKNPALPARSAPQPWIWSPVRATRRREGDLSGPDRELARPHAVVRAAAERGARVPCQGIRPKEGVDEHQTQDCAAEMISHTR
jgi:hypothetical protein